MRDFSNCRSVFRSVVESLLIGVGAWLVGALLFLGGQGVLSLLLVLVGIVTAGLLGGFVGGLLNTSCWSLGFFRRARGDR